MGRRRTGLMSGFTARGRPADEQRYFQGSSNIHTSSFSAASPRSSRKRTLSPTTSCSKSISPLRSSSGSHRASTRNRGGCGVCREKYIDRRLEIGCALPSVCTLLGRISFGMTLTLIIQFNLGNMADSLFFSTCTTNLSDSPRSSPSVRDRIARCISNSLSVSNVPVPIPVDYGGTQNTRTANRLLEDPFHVMNRVIKHLYKNHPAFRAFCIPQMSHVSHCKLCKPTSN
jgi:hypothetical protein